jgi:hypothetical protein
VDSANAWAFVQDNYKLVVQAEKVALYDLAKDPGEKRNIAGEIPRRTRGLLSLAVSLRSNRKAGPGETAEEQGSLDEETLEQLRSLGYIQ